MPPPRGARIMLKQRIKELRIGARMSQQALAAKLGVSQQTVAGWEGGRANPDRHALAKLVEIFGVTSDYLLGISQTPWPAADPAPALDNAYLSMAKMLCEQGITPEDLEVLLDARSRFLRLNGANPDKQK